jgi:hypothetical protein
MVNRTYAGSPGLIKKMYQIDYLSLLDVAYFETTGKPPSLEVFDGLVDKASLIANQAMEAVEGGINSINEKIMDLGSRLAGEDQKNIFYGIWKSLESAWENSMASRVGYLRHIGVIKQGMISETGRINIGDSDDIRLLDVEGYRYNRRTIKRWEKAKTVSEPILAAAEPVSEVQVVKVQQDIVPEGLDRGAYEMAKNGLVPSNEIIYLTSTQRSLKKLKDIIAEGTIIPIGEAARAIGRLIRGEDEDGNKIPPRSLLEMVNGYLEPSLGTLGRVIGDGTSHHHHSLWERVKGYFGPSMMILFGKRREEQKMWERYHEMDEKEAASLQSTI